MAARTSPADLSLCDAEETSAPYGWALTSTVPMPPSPICSWTISSSFMAHLEGGPFSRPLFYARKILCSTKISGREKRGTANPLASASPDGSMSRRFVGSHVQISEGCSHDRNLGKERLSRGTIGFPGRCVGASRPHKAIARRRSPRRDRVSPAARLSGPGISGSGSGASDGPVSLDPARAVRPRLEPDGRLGPGADRDRSMPRKTSRPHGLSFASTSASSF